MEKNHEWIIQTHQLSRKFGKITAVNHLNLDVPVGSVYGFLGPNGAGKTTTIRMLLGLLHPSAGSINLFGFPCQPGSWQHLNQIGTMVESPSLYLNLTGRENLEVTRRLINVPKKNIDHALEQVNMLQASKDAPAFRAGISTDRRTGFIDP